jgi:hypothetical protein
VSRALAFKVLRNDRRALYRRQNRSSQFEWPRQGQFLARGAGKERAGRIKSRHTNNLRSHWLPEPNETANYEQPIAVDSPLRFRPRRKSERKVEGPPSAPKASPRQRTVWLAQAKGEVRTKDLI